MAKTTAAPDKMEVTGDHVPTLQGLPQWKLAGWFKGLICITLISHFSPVIYSYLSSFHVIVFVATVIECSYGVF